MPRARPRPPILVDTNVILESHRVGCWRALTGGREVETVEDCVMETHTGYQRRREEQRIDPADLRKSLAAVHAVTPKEMAMAALRDPLHSALDLGERSLWAHALMRKDAWVLCGPDRASMRFGVRLGLRERLVALETLLGEVGFQVKKPLRSNYTAKWLADALSQIVVLEGGKP